MQLRSLAWLTLATQYIKGNKKVTLSAVLALGGWQKKFEDQPVWGIMI